jgi:ferredoxin-NADP reductase
MAVGVFNLVFEWERRSYSVASIPEFSEVPGGFASDILFNLKPGQVLRAIGPAGRLTLKSDEPKKPLRLILIRTGTGIGPQNIALFKADSYAKVIQDCRRRLKQFG